MRKPNIPNLNVILQRLKRVYELESSKTFTDLPALLRHYWQQRLAVCVMEGNVPSPQLFHKWVHVTGRFPYEYATRSAIRRLCTLYGYKPPRKFNNRARDDFQFNSDASLGEAQVNWLIQNTDIEKVNGTSIIPRRINLKSEYVHNPVDKVAYSTTVDAAPITQIVGQCELATALLKDIIEFRLKPLLDERKLGSKLTLTFSRSSMGSLYNEISRYLSKDERVAIAESICQRYNLEYEVKLPELTSAFSVRVAFGKGPLSP